MSLISKFLDERFFEHRRKSTSIAGVTGGVLAILLFEYRWHHDRRWDWDLLAVGLAFVVVKLIAMAWYYLTD
jgi:hypothetical protein